MNFWEALPERPCEAFLLCFVTAIAEIVGCYLPWLWLKQGGSAWRPSPGCSYFFGPSMD